MEKNILNYDYLAFQVYWEASKNFTKKSKIEQSFLNEFFYKYQILVITEDNYKRKDLKDRLKDIGKNSFLLKEMVSGSISDIRKKAFSSFNTDILFLIKEKKEKKYEKQRILRDLSVPVMGFKGLDGTPSPYDDDEDDYDDIATFIPKKDVIKKDTIKIINKDKEKVLKEILKEEDVKKPVTIEEKRTKLISEQLSNKEENKEQILLKNQKEERLENLEKSVNKIEKMLESYFEHLASKEIKNTGTSIDGSELIKIQKKTGKDIIHLLEISKGGQKWDEVALKDIPDWLKIQFISGLKRLALTTIKIPLALPKALINGFIIGPMNIVVQDVQYIGKQFQRLIGWGIVCIVIANICFIYYDPEFDNEKQQIYNLYKTFEENIVVKIVITPSVYTAKAIWSFVPGSLFFSRVYKLLENVPSYTYEWAKQAIVYTIAATKNMFSEILNDWWKSKMENFRLW